ncbi:hypothetical protein SSIL_0294 [Solibacillus silvestris StLB046]|uniref:Uncharacterized protein n=1 Tax=Solibacillus silvestris (strain StLB046) TaxID=1002809 RepID=F2F5D4_SOLSS|nr:hypothetical protein SSIL_0294 [Solibacillus silvestris StLB046]
MEAKKDGEDEKIDGRRISNCAYIKFGWLRYFKQFTPKAYRPKLPGLGLVGRRRRMAM